MYINNGLQAGFPNGVINVVNGFGRTAGAALTAHKHIDKIAFTGSTAVGKTIMEIAAKSNLKRVSLELGGKSPLVVFPDVNGNQTIEFSNLLRFNPFFFSNLIDRNHRNANSK